MSAPLLSPADIRAALGSKADGLTDTDLEAMARRIRALSMAVLEQARTRAHAATA
jgi:hypothetical protein